ncbi:hypothetical protein KO561_05255 [Radiobacillus kanasensis]|uniref:hypothetical protein n=1 Tax=Radiobacillus kanasensis TaxID=2844358 RepID=UPI001E2F5A86|nr:hypothetical protein [Radiobacillus kanasensis]UFU00358.1 hypothetical protein KO561_05255 [Radiobacillus kanasensis]
MKIEDAEKRIQELEKFIHMMKTYEDNTMEKKAYKLYVETESVTKVANSLNELGYRTGTRKVIGKDVSDLIRKKHDADPMHEIAKKMFSSNSRRVSRVW